MQKTVLKQIDELNQMSMAQLRKRWADLMGTDPGRLGRQYLMRRLAYRIQELAYGGLSPHARKQLEAVADTGAASTIMLDCMSQLAGSKDAQNPRHQATLFTILVRGMTGVRNEAGGS